MIMNMWPRCVCSRICVRVCSTRLPGAHRGQKSASDALQLEFQMDISHCSSTYSLGPQLTSNDTETYSSL